MSIRRAPGSAMRLGIIIVAVVVFALFYLVGFNMPYELEPQYNEPMLTDEVIWLMWVVLAVAILTAAWSVYRIIRTRRNTSGSEFGVPTRKIALSLTVFTLVMLVASYLLSSTDPIVINGKAYTDPFWLSIAGMFIVTVTVLLVIAIIAVIFGKLHVQKA